MPRSRKMLHMSLLAGLLIAGLSWLLSPGTVAQAAPREALPYSAYAAGPYTTRGNTILDAQGQPYYFHGVARDGLEFSCKGDAYLTLPYLALMGPPVPGVTGAFWYGNTVRLPLSEAFWLHGQTQQKCSATSYQILARKTIDTLSLLHLNVIIDLQWTDAGAQSSGGAWQMPDNDSLLFWRQMARLYGQYPNILFELYNEPHPYASTGNPWGCWRNGCQVVNDTSNDFYCGCHLSLSYHAVGMQTLAATIRAAGARNLLLVGGLNWGYDLSNLPNYALSGSNIVYDVHPYPYQGKLTLNDWETGFGQISGAYPVISAESGEYDCQAGFMQRLIAYFDAHRISWIGWAWYAQGSPCNFPQLVRDYYGTPEPAMGMYIYQTLLRYAGVPPRTSFTPPPASFSAGSGPVSAQWYFPGEPAGGGFSQELILDNATAQDCAVTIQYALQPVRATRVKATLKTLLLRLQALERITEQVNNDLGIPAIGPATLVAALVRVDGGATPGCAGIVAERAVHLNTTSLLGGSAMAGLTGASETFFFADVPTARDNSSVSALSVFNPGASAATVTVSYFAGGRVVNTQKSTVLAFSSSQITPPANLPTHVGAELDSDQPLVAMRSTLQTHITVGKTAPFAGFSETPGAAQSAGDWLFAEGYTGPDFQERLLIANPAQSGTAHLTIALLYANGSSGVFQTSLVARSQLTWDVNAHAASNKNATPEVAMEVSSDTPVVAERVIAFRYQFGNSDQVTGITALPGLPRSAVGSAYTFADGYIADGFDEWLLLENVTDQRELLTLTLVHAGNVMTYQCYLPPRGRGTISIGRLLRTLAKQDGYDVSLVVQSGGGAFVAERVLYWHMDGKQGASDVPGYAGSGG